MDFAFYNRSPQISAADLPFFCESTHGFRPINGQVGCTIPNVDSAWNPSQGATCHLFPCADLKSTPDTAGWRPIQVHIIVGRFSAKIPLYEHTLTLCHQGALCIHSLCFISSFTSPPSPCYDTTHLPQLLLYSGPTMRASSLYTHPLYRVKH